MTTRHPEYDHPLPGYGSFKRSDHDDAKRRKPATSLEGYAQARGLKYVGTLNANGFLGVMPGDSRLQFNVMAELLPGGRRAIAYHEVHAVPYSSGIGPQGDGGGVWHVSYMPKRGKRDALAFIPGVGGLIDAFVPEVDKRPDAIGIPTTVGAALVPEAATLPHMSWGATTELPDAALADRVLRSSAATAMQRFVNRPYWKVTARYGVVSLRVDGYLYDDAELDELREAVAELANGLAEAAAPLNAPQPFATELPTAEWPESYGVLNIPENLPPAAWLPWLRTYAQERGAAIEDPVAYHRAFPRVLVPGRAFAVMRLPMPGSSATGRVVWHNELDIRTHNVGCNGVLLPATGDADPVRVDDLAIQYGARDGIFAAWSLRKWKTQEEGMGDMDGLIAQAVRIGRETGLADS